MLFAYHEYNYKILQISFKNMDNKQTIQTRARSKSTKQSFTRKTIIKKSIGIGTICEVEITSLTSRGIGMGFLGRDIRVFVPTSKIGEVVQIEITKVQKQFNKIKYVIGRKIKTVKSNVVALPNLLTKVLSVRITKLGPLGSGLAELNFKDKIYSLIIPNAKVGNEYSVKVTRLKQNYGFAKIVKSDVVTSPNSFSSKQLANVKVGTTLTLTIPTKAPRYGKYLAIKTRVNSEICLVLVRLSLGAKVGQRVRVQITKPVTLSANNLPVFLAKVIKLKPLAGLVLKQRTKQTIRQMVKHGLHFGEKTVKCQANMKKFLWVTKSISTSKLGGSRPIIKNGRYFVNLLKTRQCLKQALKAVSKYAAKGRNFLFVGTSKIAAGLIARAALFSKNFFVNTRWLGGMLTNWKTIVKSISKIRPILQQKQEIMAKILQKRKRIKQYFLSKLDKLNLKTKLLVQVGRSVLEKLKQNGTTTTGSWATMSLLSRNTLLLEKRQQLIEKAQVLFTKRQQLLAKSEQLEKTNQQLYTNISQLQTKYRQLIGQFTVKRNKLREFKALLIVSLKLNQLLQQQGAKAYTGAYGHLAKFTNSSSEHATLAIVPNPAKELFNKMILAMRGQTESITTNVTSKAETGNLVVFSKLLIKFSQSSSYLEERINSLHSELKELVQEISQTHSSLLGQKEMFAQRMLMKQGIYKELTIVRTQLAAEQKLVAIVKTKLVRLDAQRRLLAFIPRVKALAIRYKAVGSMNSMEATAAQQNIQQTVQLVMRRLVDPKLKYSMDAIFDSKLRTKSKKIAAARKKKWQSLLKYLGGIANMTKLTQKRISNNIAIIIGQQENLNAVRECKKMGIKMVNIVDTNCNPALADHIIPANDDSRNSIKYVLTHLLTYIRLAQKLRTRIQQVRTNNQKIQKMFKFEKPARSKGPARKKK